MRARTVVLLGAASVVTLAAQPPAFEPVQTDLFAAGNAFVNAWADYDGDGDADLFVGFNGAANRLYRNDGGTFVDVAATVGVADPRPTRAAAWGDWDADGDPDLLVGYAPGSGSVLRLYRNDAGASPGDGRRFVDVTRDAGALATDSGAVRQPAWIDYDGDGDLDLFVAFRDRPNALFRNEAPTGFPTPVRRFTNVAAEAGLSDVRKSVGAVWLDFDADGDLDLYLANMDGDANALYRNDRAGRGGTRFTDVAESLGVQWGGRAPRDATNGTVRPCAADVDNDGRLDLFAANYGPNGLFLNRGGRFDDASAAWGVAVDGRYDTCAFADVDNDGWLDLYVNGTVTGGTSYPDYLYRNTGTRLDDVTPANVRALHADHGAAWADFDGDGDLDLALTGVRPDGMHFVLGNTLVPGATRRSLAVRVVDPRGRATRAGAEVRVYAAGTRRLLGTRLVDTGSGYDAQSDLPVHVGLGDVRRVDVEVTWPNGARRVVTRARGVDAAAYAGKALVVRVGA